jgi:hypothetical protein
MADIFSARRGEQASIDALKDYVAPTLSAEQEAGLNDTALGIDREAGTITDDRTGNTYSLNSAQGKNVLKYNTQNYEDLTNQPGDAPAGTHWDWDPYNRKWTLYKDFTNEPAGGNGGATGGNGGNTGNTGGTTLKTAEQIAADATAAANKAGRQSAYDLLYSQFKQYGLESLVEGIKDLIQKDVSPSQFTIELRNSPAYLKRFAANAARVKAGYRALDEGTYLALEDSYQNLMRNYGLPASYWEKGELGVQPGFEKLIAGNVDPIELEQRLVQAVDQIEKGPKEYMDAIKQFYPEISRSDLLSYVLDPTNALKTIQSKVKAAQIGGEYLRAGLGTDVTRASELATQGVTADIARASIPTIMETAKRGGELAGFYGDAGLGLYDQATAEEEIYNLGKAAEAKKKREKLVGLEQASFAGTSGLTRNALDAGRQGAY